MIFHEEHILPKFIVHLTKKEVPEVPKAPSTPSNELPENFEDWDVEKVVQWFATLKLSKDYSETIRREGIDGTVLSVMQPDDFRSIGITAFGDTKKLDMQVSRRRRKE